MFLYMSCLLKNRRSGIFIVIVKRGFAREGTNRQALKTGCRRDVPKTQLGASLSTLLDSPYRAKVSTYSTLEPHRGYNRKHTKSGKKWQASAACDAVCPTRVFARVSRMTMVLGFGVTVIPGAGRVPGIWCTQSAEC